MKQSPHVLLLPGWQGSGIDHWQSHWERRYGFARVQQHDWQRPLRGDWTARLEECVPDAPAPVVHQRASGHINAESGLGDWPAGKALLDALLAI